VQISSLLQRKKGRDIPKQCHTAQACKLYIVLAAIAQMLATHNVDKVGN